MANPDQRSATSDDLVLNGLTIVDTHNGRLAPDMSVVISRGKIVRIAPSESTDTNSSTRSIDAHAKFAVPGYLDLHAHPLNSADREGSLTMMLANGITGVSLLAL